MKKHLVILLLAALSLNTVQATEICNSESKLSVFLFFQAKQPV